MNKQRHQLYVNLINALLNCPSGEEPIILTANSDVIDTGLLQTMVQAAAELAEQGDHNSASWLQNLVSQLTEAICGSSEQQKLKAEADRLLQQGIQQYHISQFQATLQSCQQALTIYLNIKDRKGEGQALGRLGIAYFALGDYVQAIENYQQSLNIAREIEDIHGEGQALNNLGLAYSELGYYTQAIEYYQQSLVFKRITQDRLGEENSLRNLGIAYNSRGNYNRAIEYHEQSLVIARDIGDRHGEGQGLGNIGATYNDLGDYQQAINYAQQSLLIMREIKSLLGEERALANLGTAYSGLGKYDKTIEYHQKSLAIAQEIGNVDGASISLQCLGSTYHALGDYGKAIEYHQQSLTIAQQIGNRQGEGSALGGLGHAHDALGEYEKAIEYHQQSLTIARQIGDRREEGNSLGSLGLAYDILGNYGKAIEYHQQYLQITQEIGNYEGEATALGHLGWAYNALGDYSRAIKYHQESLATAQKIGNRSIEGAALANLGVAYDALGNYHQALDYYQQSLAVMREIGNRQGVAESLGNLGRIHYFYKNYTRAINYYKQTLEILRQVKDRRGEGMCLNNLGLAYEAIGAYEQGIEYLEQSLAIAREIKDQREQWASLNNLGYAFLDCGNLTAAEKFLSIAIEICESLRGSLGRRDSEKVSIFETQASTYQLLQLVLTTQKKTDVALEIAERGRARAFVELLAEQLSPQSIGQFTSPPPTLHKIQQIAQVQNSTIVEYSIIYDVLGQESKLFIWVIKATGEIGFQSVDFKLLQQEENTSFYEIVLQVRSSLGIKDKLINTSAVSVSKAPQLLQQLYQYLIQPIVDLLPTDPNAPVIFIPQGSLFLVPFPALQDGTGKFLIEQHTILTAPSIQTLNLTRQQRQRIGTIDASFLQGEDILVVGNPTMPTIPLKETPEPLNPLPGAEAEAKAIASLFKSQAIIGDKGTKVEIVKQMPKVRLIHLATHGLLDDIRQLGVPGAIALAPSSEDNGFLTAGEILKMKLNAELIVLSACSSGQGKITGDGVIGLSRSLFVAGVPTVIASLWAVGDNSTQFLMTQFYSYLRSGMNKAQALRQAMLTTMKKKQYSRPKSWAAFTLMGEAE